MGRLATERSDRGHQQVKQVPERNAREAADYYDSLSDVEKTGVVAAYATLSAAWARDC